MKIVNHVACRLWVLGFLLTGWAGTSSAAVDLGTYKGCAANDGQFKMTKMVSGPSINLGNQSNGIVKMDLVGQDDGSMDIYFI